MCTKFSNVNDNLDHAAKVLRRSAQAQRVFEAIYTGKKAIKTQQDIRSATKLSAVRILQITDTLAANNLIHREKIGGQFAYKKEKFYSVRRDKVLALARDKKKLERLPTKTRPQNGFKTVTLKLPSQVIRVKEITIDDLDAFSKVKKIPNGQVPRPIAEDRFKKGFQSILGEKGKFTDWGGELHDLFTTKVRIKSKRYSSVFAFKGKGKKGILKPKDFGKNGDQIQRLFNTDVQVFVLQYWGQLDVSVYQMMKTYAVAKSALSPEKIYFGVIDGDDTQRLLLAYPRNFR